MDLHSIDSVKTVSLHFVSVLLCIVKYLTNHFIHLIIILDDEMNLIDNDDSMTKMTIWQWRWWFDDKFNNFQFNNEMIDNSQFDNDNDNPLYDDDSTSSIWDEVSLINDDNRQDQEVWRRQKKKNVKESYHKCSNKSIL